MAAKTNVSMNWDYPDVFTIEVSICEVKQALVLSLEQVRLLKGQISDALAEYDQLLRLAGQGID